MEEISWQSHAANDSRLLRWRQKCDTNSNLFSCLERYGVKDDEQAPIYLHPGEGTVWSRHEKLALRRDYPDSKVYGAIMGPTWVLSAPDGPHVGPMNLAIRVVTQH